MNRLQPYLTHIPAALPEAAEAMHGIAVFDDLCGEQRWGFPAVVGVVVRHIHEIPPATSTIEQAALELRLTTLERQLRLVQAERRSAIVPIATLRQHGLEITEPIPAVVQEEDDVFVASFFDANINESGGSQLEAVEMLKAAIASTFRFLSDNERALGTEPARQLSVLREFIRVP